MAEYTKSYYSIGEVSQMLNVPIYTLRYWEDEFPMFNPNRSARGTRRFTPADINMAIAIREALYEKRMKIDGAIEYLSKTYCSPKQRRRRKCGSNEEAINLLSEVKLRMEDATSIAKLQAVINYLS